LYGYKVQRQSAQPMSVMRKILLATAALIACAVLSPASAEILNLQCSNQTFGPRFKLNYWIDFDKKTITVQLADEQAPNNIYDTYAVQISPTLFSFSTGTEAVRIDRTSGVATYYHSIQNLPPQGWGCSVGNAPFPAPPRTKF
jgi:hypothetical protein